MDKSKWEYKKLGEVAQYPKKRLGSEFLDIDNYVGVENLLKDKGGRINALSLPTNTSTIEYKENDILIGNIRPYLKKIWFADRHGGASGDVVNIRVKENYRDRINPKFLYCVLSTDAFFTFDMAHSKGAKMPRGNKDEIVKYSIPLPPVADQQRIVAELDCLNEMIALKQEQLKEFDKLAQSIFYDMFGDPMDNVHEWGISILEDVVSDSCSISYGIVQPGEDVENGVPVVRPVDLVNQVVYKDGLKIVDKAISDSYKRTILKGDELLFCVRGTTGIISFASEELEGCNVTRGITPLEFGNRIDKYYAYYLLKTPYMQSLIAEKTNGIALKQINMRDVRLLPIVCPPLALQQQFAEKIQAIEAQKELVKKSIAETQQLLDSRMDYYFD